MSSISKLGSLKGLSSLEALRTAIAGIHAEFRTVFSDAGSVFPIDAVDDLTVGLIEQNKLVIEIVDSLMTELSATVDGSDDALAQIDAIFNKAESSISNNISKTFSHH